MTTGFDQPLEDSFDEVVNGLEALSSGSMPLVFRYLNTAREFELRFEERTFQGLTDYEATIVASTGTVVATSINARLDLALAKATILASIAQPETAPLGIAVFVTGITVTSQISGFVGDLAGDAVATMITSDLFQNHILSDQGWTGLGQGSDLDIKLFAGNNIATNEQVDITLSPTATGFNATVTTPVSVSTASIIEALGNNFNSSIYNVPTDGVVVQLTNGTETLKGIYGSSLQDSVNLSSDINYVRLDDGNDSVIASDGTHTIDGGAGTDLLDYSQLSTGIEVDLGAGIAVQAGQSQIKDVIDGIGNVVGTASADTLLGDENANILTGGNGADELDGGDGSDTLYGGDGNDTFFGSEGNDRMEGQGGSGDLADYSLLDRGLYFDMNEREVFELDNGAKGAQKDVLTSIYELIATGEDDVLVSADRSNATGILRNDTLDGAAGDDLIISSYGNDLYIGGAGDDTIQLNDQYGSIALPNFETDIVQDVDGKIDLTFNGVGWDTVTASEVSTGTDIVSVENYTNPTYGDFIYITFGNHNGIAGNSFAVITDHQSFNTTYSGGQIVQNYTAPSGASNDLMVLFGTPINFSGEGGIDTDYHPEIGFMGLNTINRMVILEDINIDLANINVDLANDVVQVGTYSPPPPPGEALAGTSGSDTLNTGAGNDTIWANGGNDTVTSGEGNDTVYGGEGDDSIFGNAGDDVVAGDNGNDTVFGDEGNDTVTGGDGDDVVYGSDGDDNVDGGAGNDFVTGDAGNDYVLGNLGNDQVYGFTGQDSLFGQAGNDTLQGEADNDYVDGGDGNDGLYGGTGDDVIYGQAGADWMVGGDGNDVLVGGLGVDGMYGSGGADIFAFFSEADSTVAQYDWIHDFVSGTDQLDLSQLATGISVIGSSTFAGNLGSAELRYDHAWGNTIVQLDSNGDSVTNLQIVLAGTVNLSVSELAYN